MYINAFYTLTYMGTVYLGVFCNSILGFFLMVYKYNKHV
jgi:hypothetical protein